MEGYRTEQETLNSTIHETIVHNGSMGGGLLKAVCFPFVQIKFDDNLFNISVYDIWMKFEFK